MHSHGGNPRASVRALGRSLYSCLDASASLVPFGPPVSTRLSLRYLRYYPDPTYFELKRAISAVHGLDPDYILPGNGAAELFTWAARDAVSYGFNYLPSPGFFDYRRALTCWRGTFREIPLSLEPQSIPADFRSAESGGAIWISNPHNPTGHLWTRESLIQLLSRHSLVICDEAFLPLVPGGEEHSLLPFVALHPNLIVIRSLTKLFGIAGVRLGYAVAQPNRLIRWSTLRDPWPVNSIAAAMGISLLGDRLSYGKWCKKVQDWVASEGAFFQRRFLALPHIEVLPSHANFCLIRGRNDRGLPLSLVPLREMLEDRFSIYLRDCRNFTGLGDSWLRIGYQRRRSNLRIVAAIERLCAAHASSWQ